MALWLLLLMLKLCATIADPTDLSGKLLTFPEETIAAYVKLIPSATYLTAVTVCLRFKTDLQRNHVLFSLATPIYSNGFLIFKDSTSDVVEVYVQNIKAQFVGQECKLNTWHSICSTWDASSGLVQLWFDGKATIKRYTGGTRLNRPIIMIGQDQDTYGGYFEKNQSFIGMICDVHMWNNVIKPCEIQHFMDNDSFTAGNVINWGALEFEQRGRVVTEEKIQACDNNKHHHSLFS